MHLVHRVLEALQPVARHELRLVLDEPLGLRRRVGREGRRRALAEIGKDETEMFPRRIAADPHLAGKARLLRRLLDALSTALEFPAVIDAADVVAFDPAQMHLRAAMRAAVIDDLRLPGLSPVEREILAHDADRFGMPFRQILAAHDRHPEASHKAAHRRSRSGARQIELRPRVAFDRVHDAPPDCQAGILSAGSACAGSRAG